MKKTKFSAYIKPIMLIIAGIILAFTPNFLSGIFYIIGGAIIILNIVTLIAGAVSVAAAPVAVPKAILGIIFGAIIIAVPTLLSFALTYIIGIFLCVTGIDKFCGALRNRKSSSNWIVSAVLGAVIVFSGLFMCFNPFKSAGIFTKIIGIILIISGIISLVNNSRSGGDDSLSSVIDLDSFSVKDDDEHRRLK